jgi:hypothetical protein
LLAACGSSDGGEEAQEPVDMTPAGGGAPVTPPSATATSEPPPATPTSSPPAGTATSYPAPVTPGPTPVFPARCLGDASQTIMIGDSYLALSGEVTRFLESYAGQAYRHYYVSGTQMQGGLPPSIPDQARMALTQGPVESVIMDGGGNDVLIGDFSCRLSGPAPGSGCEATVLRIADTVAAFMGELAAAGVREVVYFFYPYLPNNAGLNATLDFGAPLVEAACENAAGLDCNFIDLRGAFDGHPEYIGLDGIHPTTAGSEVIAGLLWDEMQATCANGLDP